MTTQTTDLAELDSFLCVPQFQPAPVPPSTVVAAPLTLAYSHQAMVDLILAHPEYSHAQLCKHFNRPASWLSSILASDAFQSTLDPHRHLITDPTLTATMQERYRALAIRTSNVLLEKLDNPEADPLLVLRASEISIKALGMGNKVTDAPQPPPRPPTETLAERLLAMMDQTDAARTVDMPSPNGTV